MVAGWRAYQQEVADFFSSLGFEANVDVRAEGVRATHLVDALVRFESFGLQHSWIIECKAWTRRVSKHEVMALRGIVDDLGADRGFLLSERGFQPAAIAAAHLSNVSLTNLRDLQTRAEPDLLDARRRRLEERAVALSDRIDRLSGLDADPILYFGKSASVRDLLGTLDRSRFGRPTAEYREQDSTETRLRYRRDAVLLFGKGGRRP